MTTGQCHHCANMYGYYHAYYYAPPCCDQSLSRSKNSSTGEVRCTRAQSSDGTSLTQRHALLQRITLPSTAANDGPAQNDAKNRKHLRQVRPLQGFEPFGDPHSDLDPWQTKKSPCGTFGCLGCYAEWLIASRRPRPGDWLSSGRPAQASSGSPSAVSSCDANASLPFFLVHTIHRRLA